MKNTLAVVQGLALHTRADSVEAFRAAFVGRLDALARAHALLFESNWRSADITGVVGQTLAAYLCPQRERIRLTGGPVSLTPKQALGLSLILNELATNAVKYGALSAEGGSLEIAWQTAESRRLHLSWRETGGPPVVPAGQHGFGLSLIVQASEYELDGEAVVTLAPEGLRCEITFSLS